MSPELKSKSFADRLMAVHNAVLSLQRVPMFREAVARYGYNEEKLEDGYLLYDEAFQLFQEQQETYLEYAAAVQEFNEVRARAEYTYLVHLKLARVAFRQRKDIIEKLGLKNQRKTLLGEWLKQASEFYNTALDSDQILDAFVKSDITPDLLEAALALMDEVKKNNEDVEIKQKETLEITDKRDKAFFKMERWWSQMMKVADAALSDSINSLGKIVS